MRVVAGDLGGHRVPFTPSRRSVADPVAYPPLAAAADPPEPTAYGGPLAIVDLCGGNPCHRAGPGSRPPTPVPRIREPGSWCYRCGRHRRGRSAAARVCAVLRQLGSMSHLEHFIMDERSLLSSALRHVIAPTARRVTAFAQPTLSPPLKCQANPSVRSPNDIVRQLRCSANCFLLGPARQTASYSVHCFLLGPFGTAERQSRRPTPQAESDAGRSQSPAQDNRPRRGAESESRRSARDRRQTGVSCSDLRRTAAHRAAQYLHERAAILPAHAEQDEARE